MSADAQTQQHDPKEPTTVKVDTSEQVEPDQGTTLTVRQRDLLVRVLTLAYPHPSFPAGPYHRSVDAIVTASGGNAALAACLSPGLDDLDRHAGGDFLALDDAAGTLRLRELQDEPWFVGVRATAVVALYDDHEVWDLLGYEGSSFEHGGYVSRGFDDLDWLPPARIEEHPDLAPEGKRS